MRYTLDDGFTHLTNFNYKEFLVDELTMLGGGGSSQVNVPIPNITLFYLLMVVHAVATVLLFIEAGLIKYEKHFAKCCNLTLRQFYGFFSNSLCTFFYLIVILYCIFKQRLFADDCDTYVESWLKFEIRILNCWLVSCAIFLFYASVFHIESKWKLREERLGLRDIWSLKDS